MTKYGEVSQYVREEVAAWPAGVRFSASDLYSEMELRGNGGRRQALQTKYGSDDKAVRAVAQVLSNLRDIRLVEKRRGVGKSLWVSDTESKKPTDVAEKVVFTLAGYTGDGEAVWRREDTNTLGWFEWKEL